MSVVPKRFKKANQTWVFLDKDTDLGTLKRRLASQRMRVFSNYTTKRGKVYRLDCSGESSCPMKMRIIEVSGSDYFIAEYLAGLNHVHKEESVQKEKLRGILKQEWVLNTFDADDTPTKILKKLLESDSSIKIDDPKKLLNKIAKRKERHQRKLLEEYACINTHELESWIKDFVTQSESNAASDTSWRALILDSKLGNGSDHSPIHILFSSINLLQNVVRQQKFDHPFLCIDATYKLNHKRYPLIVVGTQDRLHKFHLVAFCVSSHEDEAAYAFVLQGLQKGIKKYLKIEYTPEYIMSDGALAIYNASEASFGSVCKNLMCYYHLQQACDRKMKEMKVSNQIKHQILADLSFLRMISFQTLFDHHYSKARKSWNSLSAEFLKYFEDEFMKSKRFRWRYQFIPGALPNTNNALEGFNRSLKYVSTCRVSLSFSKFLKFLVEQIQFKSRMTSIFIKRPLIKSDLWEEAEHYRKVGSEHSSGEFFFNTESSEKKVTDSQIMVATGSIKKVADHVYLTLAKSVCKVNISGEFCTCTGFRKTSQCPHVIATLLIKQILTKPTSLVERRKRGRSKRMSKALETDIIEKPVKKVKKNPK